MKTTKSIPAFDEMEIVMSIILFIQFLLVEISVHCIKIL